MSGPKKIADEIMKKAREGHWTHGQLLDILNNEEPRNEEERRQIEAEAEAIKGKPIDEWPQFDVQWDLELDSQRYALDGESAEDFRKIYPDALSIVWVKMVELDLVLTPHSKRTPDEIWSVGNQNKAARCIVHWANGRRMTPPLAIVVHQQVGLEGGHHRLAVARAKHAKVVPLLVAPTIRSRLCEIVTCYHSP